MVRPYLAEPRLPRSMEPAHRNAFQGFFDRVERGKDRMLGPRDSRGERHLLPSLWYLTPRVGVAALIAFIADAAIRTGMYTRHNPKTIVWENAEKAVGHSMEDVIRLGKGIIQAPFQYDTAIPLAVALLFLRTGRGISRALDRRAMAVSEVARWDAQLALIEKEKGNRHSPIPLAQVEADEQETRWFRARALSHTSRIRTAGRMTYSVVSSALLAGSLVELPKARIFLSSLADRVSVSEWTGDTLFRVAHELPAITVATGAAILYGIGMFLYGLARRAWD